MSRMTPAFAATQEVLRMEQAAYEAATQAHMQVMDRAPVIADDEPCGRCKGTGVTMYTHRVHLGVPGGCFRCDCRGKAPSVEGEKLRNQWVSRAELARLRVLWRGLSAALAWGVDNGAFAEHLTGLRATLATVEREGKITRSKAGR